MKSSPQCLDCIGKAAERILRISKIQSEKNQLVMEKVKNYLSKVNRNLTPMEISFGMNEIIQRETGIYDPFKKIKEESNVNALKLISRANLIIKKSDKPIFDAIKISIAGNIIDYGMELEYNLSDTLEEVLRKNPFINDFQLLKEKLTKSKIITILADNAGEIVFDKLLIENINRMFNIDKINLIVKTYPFMNDIILEDVKDLDFDEIPNVKIIALENSTKADYFKNLKPFIQNVDVVIAKGQGNFELLYNRNLGIFFLFIVKCKEIRDVMSAEEGESIISYH
ncbi:MAG: DUF89 family protein [Candidatus Heimdallarchaeota archaeon]|nr:protein-glutamate O-methyltransferase family protein [Candidatus Heimdallarchaeota archaeon]MCG3257115.1 DUF89 family protein [Candidatus Heimdallarchaeota archaeon]MCK4612175.1 DUF89 family protein [Candidatus Heimdallarchaeota archaeon]